MKKVIAVLLICTMLLAGCTTNTEYGQCIGLGDKEKPNLVYKLSIWNTVLAVIFIETVIVPIWVAVDLAKCPIAKQ